MVEKLGRGLHFCINYYKLNAIMYKDHYPLPLINKILEYISKVKIFTKLDIHQGFH
jgi:Leucine-rich repeat (LRR) protein